MNEIRFEHLKSLGRETRRDQSRFRRIFFYIIMLVIGTAIGYGIGYLNGYQFESSVVGFFLGLVCAWEGD